MTMHPSLEEVTQAAVDLVTSQIGPTLQGVSAYYAASDAASSRTVPLPPPPVYYGEPDSPMLARPVVFIYAPDKNLLSLGTQDATQGNAEFTVTLHVEAYLVSDTTDTVERMYTRFAEAIEDIFYRHPELGGTAVSVSPRRAERVKSPQPFTRILRYTLSVLIYPTY